MALDCSRNCDGWKSSRRRCAVICQCGLRSVFRLSFTAASLTAAISSPTNGSTLVGSSQLFTWNAVTGVTQYQLWVGSTPRGTDYFYAANLSGTSQTATGLPTAGQTVYVTLWTLVGTTWSANDYTYAAF